jgi:hypothetical protein
MTRSRSIYRFESVDVEVEVVGTHQGVEKMSNLLDELFDDVKDPVTNRSVDTGGEQDV